MLGKGNPSPLLVDFLNFTIPGRDHDFVICSEALKLSQVGLIFQFDTTSDYNKETEGT